MTRQEKRLYNGDMSLLAQVDLQNKILLNPATGTTVGGTYSTFASFLNLFIPLAFIISGLILFFLLIGGGFSIIASGGNAKSVESGKNQITGAIIGFVIIFAAYWIIQIIQTITGVQIFNSGL